MFFAAGDVGRNEPVHEIANELDDGLSGYLAKNDFKAPAGVKKLQAELQKYIEV